MDVKTLKREYDEDPSIEKLEKLRTNVVDTLEANNMYEGFKSLLTQLYPDNAHYILELLQNAEDANKNNDKPSTVTFYLYEDKLEFVHNGKNLFILSDIDSITGLGVSTKVDDKTNIGKFGVGFKSVFAITDEPEIISGKYNFSIQRLFIPKLKKYLLDVNSSESRFIFPFKKNASKTAIEIKNELFGLGSDTLLFLKNINKIEYILSDGKTIGCMAIRIDEEGIYNININIPTQEKKEYFWLRYCDEDGVDITDENGETNNYKVLIAFQLEKNDQKESKWRIIPSNPGKVCIFFPAEKETSNLLFNIHAPFASTVARDSVRTCEENNILRDAIAELISKSLIDIKKRGFLTIDFFAVLPNGDDGLSSFYEPIRQKIISTFREKSLIPTKYGNEYAPACELFRGLSNISDVIDDDDLSLLTGIKKPIWAKNAPQVNQREDKFLRSLGIKEWGKNELNIVFNPMTDDERNKVENWINSKSDLWLMKLYALLYNEEINIDVSLKIIRVTNNKCVSSLETVYFMPDEEDDDIPSNLNFVKKDLYNIGEAEKRKKDTIYFLEKIGVKKYNENERIRLKLKKLTNKYLTSSSNISEEEHIKDIKEICLHKISKDFLNEKYFILGFNKTYNKANSICTPLIGDLIEQAELSSEYKKICINKIYKEKLNNEQYNIFLNLINDLGAMHKLRVVCEENSYNRNFTIYGIDKIINLLYKNKNIYISKLIWNAVQECTFYYAGFKSSIPDLRHNLDYNTKGPSKIVEILISNEWIPDKDGIFYIPQNISVEMLHEDFRISNSSNLFKALMFSKNLEDKKSKLKKQTEAAKILGLSLNSVNLLKIAAEKAGVSVDDFMKGDFSDEKDNDEYDPERIYETDQEFPVGKITNIINLHNNVKNIWRKALPVTREKRFREIRTSYKRSNVRMYIWDHYSGFCQICQKKSPYWEVAEIFNEPKRELEHMNLSLCPKCATEFRIKRNKNIMDMFAKNILEVDPEKDVNISLEDNLKVRFTHTHLAEVKEILTLENNKVN